MDVVFLSPNYPPEMRQFTRGLAEVGARVWGIGDGPPHPSVRPYLTDYLQVPRLLDEVDVGRRAHAWLRGRNIDRVLANWEPLVILAARMRESWGLPGMSVDAVLGFRDKQLMKERIAAAGLRVPRSRRVQTEAGARAAAAEIGFPLILKPIAGAGSANTYRVDDQRALEATLPLLRGVPVASVEEFVEGTEFTYDAVCIDGVPQCENVLEYMPRPLIARSDESISPAQISVRDLDQPHVRPGLALGRAALKALGMGSGFCHMEWYLTRGGEAVFGEIACRSGGAMVVDQFNWTCDVDLFREWGRAVCHGQFAARVLRRYNVGIVFKRARGNGVIRRIDGLDRFMARHGEWVVQEALLRPGTRRRNWKATLLSDGHIALRHPDWHAALGMMREAVDEIVLHAS